MTYYGYRPNSPRIIATAWRWQKWRVKKIKRPLVWSNHGRQLVQLRHYRNKKTEIGRTAADGCFKITHTRWRRVPGPNKPKPLISGRVAPAPDKGTTIRQNLIERGWQLI